MVCVFTGGDAPEPDLCAEFFSRAEKPVAAIAADSGLETFGRYQDFFGFFDLKAAMGDWDSISDTALLSSVSGVVEEFPRDKDFTDTELALFRARSAEFSRFADKIVLVGAGGGKRIDHLLAVFDIFSDKSMRPDVWISGFQFLYLLPEHSGCEIFGLGISDDVSVFRTTAFRSGGKIESSGLQWESGLFRRSGVPSISNRISSGHLGRNLPVSVRADEGDFVLVVPNSARVAFSHGENPSESAFSTADKTPVEDANATESVNASE
ncbi:MAG: hypothetical protein IIU02_01705 [Treponema sp.]|uniref:hypothetical protein n=1 Tax=Treponema sp. TaxID=166 RepID=UPI002580D677|nr:hypothetical protein [Treponema sp.]MBQ5536620.1 hypothetical protein [Treponema sp.]